MLSKEDNELLTRVGPDTPMGEALRRYWMPALLSGELPAPDCPPVRVKLLGEELVADAGRVGGALLDLLLRRGLALRELLDQTGRCGRRRRRRPALGPVVDAAGLVDERPHGGRAREHDRASEHDAEPGQEVILVHHEHHAVASPFRASHAIYVRAGETQFDAVDEVPAQLRLRLLSVRAFDRAGLMVGADVVDGTQLEALGARLLDDERAGYLHVHYARQGCYAARIERA